MPWRKKEREGKTGEPVRESRYGARDGDGLIRGAVEKDGKRERERERGKQPEGRRT